MKNDPYEIRRALGRLPLVPQRFWTWLTGVALPEEFHRRRWTPAQHFFVTVCIFVMAAGIGTLCAQTLLSAISI